MRLGGFGGAPKVKKGQWGAKQWGSTGGPGPHKDTLRKRDGPLAHQSGVQRQTVRGGERQKRGRTGPPYTLGVQYSTKRERLWSAG
ncbi:hypothetical protein NDU88_004466 [Pleurodeles waltl]|uniref:Uncharacterized protein n=1 Tax=Pleurodeles waltl TaxID=8319 RepID=A0AAV7VGE0_PLEWA|nr:hypothetical protein NDU88_004466 [Pleurodeles waltl]